LVALILIPFFKVDQVDKTKLAVLIVSPPLIILCEPVEDKLLYEPLPEFGRNNNCVLVLVITHR